MVANREVEARALTEALLQSGREALSVLATMSALYGEVGHEAALGAIEQARNTEAPQSVE